MLGLPELLVPPAWKPYLNPERYTIDRFIRNEVVPNLKTDDLLLDAGAGFGRYKKELSGTRYESCDFEQVFDEAAKESLTFICDLANIPKENNRYDVVVNTQVLEHVEHPQRVINEFYRVLKPGGRLYLTTNQTFMVHAAPHCYYFFTRFGLASLFKNAGFVVTNIEARGGMGFVLSEFMSLFPRNIFYQLCYEGFKAGVYKKPKLKRPLLAVVLFPIFLITQFIFGVWLPLLFAALDRFDRQRYATLGYSCIAVKPAEKIPEQHRVAR